jgi:serine/threonine-protein kinase
MEPTPDDIAGLAERLLAGRLDVRPGPRAFGRYTVQRTLREGPGFTLHLAQGPVVIQAFHAPLEDRERFLRETSALEGIEDPSLVKLLDASDEGPFLVHELFDEDSLAEVTLALADGVRVLAGATRACAFLHARGLVHARLDPSCVLVSGRLLGAGAAALGPGEDPDYLAPEQVSKGEIGPWTDVHALGVLLYELLAGRTPFEADDPAAVREAIATRKPVPPSSWGSVPEELEALTLRTLAKDPARRPSAEEVLRALGVTS